jgi:hypothetical protein
MQKGKNMNATVNARCMHVYLLDPPDKGGGTASVSGSLVEETNDNFGQTQPVVNAPVYLADARDGCYIAAGLTGDKGFFSFIHLLTGEYCLKVEHKGSVRCDEGARLKIDTEGLHFDVIARLGRRRMTTSITGIRPAAYLNPLDHAISFDPNPSLDGKLNLTLKDSFKRLKLEITDLSGWIVRTMDLDEIQAGYTNAVDLEDLEKGTYLLEISTGRDRLSKQLVLQ